MTSGEPDTEFIELNLEADPPSLAFNEKSSPPPRAFAPTTLETEGPSFIASSSPSKSHDTRSTASNISCVRDCPWETSSSTPTSIGVSAEAIRSGQDWWKNSEIGVRHPKEQRKAGAVEGTAWR